MALLKYLHRKRSALSDERACSSTIADGKGPQASEQSSGAVHAQRSRPYSLPRVGEVCLHLWPD